MVYVALSGPRVLGVFETIGTAVNLVADLAEVENKRVKCCTAYNGDILLKINDYLECRLVKTTFY